MVRSQPLVSVVIPTYCAEKYIASTIQSVLDQTYQNIEVLVVDDGSTDATYDIARQIAERDPRVIVYRQSNQGVAAARNCAIGRSSGHFIAPIDHDDLWQPRCLEQLMAQMLNSSLAVGVCYAWSFDIDQDDSAIGSFHSFRIEGCVYNTLLCHNFLGNASCTLIKKSCLEDVGMYTTEFRDAGVQGCEDWELYLRIAAKYQFKVVPEFLVAYRRTQLGMSQNCDSLAASHALLMQCAERTSAVPTAIRRLSTSNFYLYLAWQCSEGKRHAEAMTWIKKALSSEWVTPLLNVEVYRMAAQAAVWVCLGKRDFKQSPTARRRVGSGGLVMRKVKLYWHQIAGNVLRTTLQLLFRSKRTADTSARPLPDSKLEILHN